MEFEIMTCHTGVCSVCNKKFDYTRLGGVMTNDCPQKKYHPKEKRCWTCRKLFYSGGALFRHLKKEPSHMVDPPRLCHWCLESFVVYSDSEGKIHSKYGVLKNIARKHTRHCIAERVQSFNYPVFNYHLHDDECTSEYEKELIRKALRKKEKFEKRVIKNKNTKEECKQEIQTLRRTPSNLSWKEVCDIMKNYKGWCVFSDIIKTGCVMGNKNLNENLPFVFDISFESWEYKTYTAVQEPNTSGFYCHYSTVKYLHADTIQNETYLNLYPQLYILNIKVYDDKKEKEYIGPLHLDLNGYRVDLRNSECLKNFYKIYSFNFQTDSDYKKYYALPACRFHDSFLCGNFEIGKEYSVKIKYINSLRVSKDKKNVILAHSC